MGILKDELSKEIESVKISDVDMVLGFESALKSIDDMDRIMSVYEECLKTESPDVLAHYMNMLTDGEEEFTPESAIQGKDGFFSKLANTVKRIAATQDEHMSWLEKALKNWDSGVENLEEILAELKANKYELKNKIGFFNKATAKAVESRFTLLKAMGLDVNKPSNIATLMTMPRIISEGVFKENAKTVELLQNNSFKNAEAFKTFLEENKIPKASKSVAFLKSLKGIELKEVDILCGMVTKVFGKQVSLITMWDDNGKLKVDSDVVTFKPVELKPQENASELIKLVEVAIDEMKKGKAIIANVNEVMKNVNKGLPNWLVHDTSAYAGIANLFSPVIRYRQNLVRAAITLQYDFWYINTYTDEYVNLMVKWK